MTGDVHRRKCNVWCTESLVAPGLGWVCEVTAERLAVAVGTRERGLAPKAEREAPQERDSNTSTRSLGRACT